MTAEKYTCCSRCLTSSSPPSLLPTAAPSARFRPSFPVQARHLSTIPPTTLDTHSTTTNMGSMNFVTFNQDHSHLGVGMRQRNSRSCTSKVFTGTTNGYRVYTTDPFNKQSESREGDVSSLEMLFSTSLVALTLSPRVLRIQNTKVVLRSIYLCTALTLCRDTRRSAR